MGLLHICHGYDGMAQESCYCWMMDGISRFKKGKEVGHGERVSVTRSGVTCFLGIDSTLPKEVIAVA